MKIERFQDMQTELTIKENIQSSKTRKVQSTLRVDELYYKTITSKS